MSNMELNTSEIWVLKSAKEAVCPDISLKKVFCEELIIGRSQLQNCTNCQFLSSQHCSFRIHTEGLILKALTKFDVISVNGELLKSGEEIVVKTNTKITLCQKFFKYSLYKVSVPFNSKRHNDLEQNGFEKRARTLEGDSTTISSSSSSTTHNNHNVQFDQLEYDSRAREGVYMALADIESTVCMRSQTALTVTKALCRALLSSFHCDICLEVIASCRSCVPCGHSYCSPCIQGVIAAAGGRGGKCPRCRTNIAQLIPNKTVDAAVSDCLSNVKVASVSCATLRMSAEVSESQDLGAWTDRYESNEAPSRAKPLAAVTAGNEDNSDEDDEEDDEDDEEDEYICCDDAEVEHARSGRATCIHCHSLIAVGVIRFGVTQRAEEYYTSTKFVHMTCANAFNSHRGARQSKIRVESLRGLHTFNAREQQLIRSSIPPR